MIRLILIALFLGLFLILTIPILIVEWIIGHFNPTLKDRSSLAIVKWAFRVIRFLTLSKVKYIDVDNIPDDQPVLYVGNHQSYFDIVFTYIMVKGTTGYIAKDGMKNFFLLATWMRNLHCLFINRKSIKEGLKTILDGVKEVKNGVSITIFPEGTRNPNPDTLMTFKEGSLKIAEKAKCPIVPVAITGTADVWEKHLPWIKSANVVIRYGKPIYLDKLSDEDKKHPGAYVQNIIQKMYLENKELL